MKPLHNLHIDEQGTLRFKESKIVKYLLDNSEIVPTTIYFPKEDWEQFSQLIGYSVSGWGGLPYVSDIAYEMVCTKQNSFNKKFEDVYAEQLETETMRLREILKSAMCGIFNLDGGSLDDLIN